MKTFTALLVTIFAVAQKAAAHGYVKSITIAGLPFQANYPFGDGSDPSGIRKVDDVVPIKGANNHDTQCGINAKPASQVLAANPGDPITFNWRGADNSFWPHDIGPWLSYLASCGNTTCDKFNADNARWFKIEQMGQKNGSNDWYQKDLMSGGVASATLPSNIAPGQYLLRHEIIALHLADQMGGAEFYATCIQLNIGGNGTGTPSPNELVSFPGAYSDNDPGIFTPNVFNSDFKYVFPGPPVSKLAATADGNGNSTSPTAPPKPAKNNSHGICRLRKSAKSSPQRRRLPRILWDLGIASNRH